MKLSYVTVGSHRLNDDKKDIAMLKNMPESG